MEAPDQASERAPDRRADPFIEVLFPRHAADELARHAHEHAFDLLVLGRKSDDLHLLGRHLLNDVSCPILVVAEGTAT